MRRTLALLSALLLALGCSDDGEQPPPAATVPSEVTTSSTAAEAPDPAVIPDDLAEIDEEYVQAVVDELFAVDAKATEIFVTTRAPLDERAIAYLKAIYTEEEVERELNSWFHALASSSENLLPGALKNDVKRILTVTVGCVYLEALRDYSDTTTRDVAERTVFLGLTPKLRGDDPEGLNPTQWMLFMDGFNPDGSRPDNPCDES